MPLPLVHTNGNESSILNLVLSINRIFIYSSGEQLTNAKIIAKEKRFQIKLEKQPPVYLKGAVLLITVL